MFSIGRICVKTAGRDAGKYCVVVEKVDDSFVIVDGQTRRRKVNTRHLEPTQKTVEIKENASTKEVIDALSKAGFASEEKKESQKSKEKKARPLRQRSQKEKTVAKKPAKAVKAKPKKE